MIRGVFVVVGILVLTVIFVSLLPLFVNFSKLPTDVVAYFEKEIQAEGVLRMGQPIEGFDAFIFLTIFPALKETDFAGVKTLEGEYYLSEGDLQYRRTAGDLITSAERMIVRNGYGTLLSNLFTRFDISPRDMFGTQRILLLIFAGDLEQEFSMGYLTNDFVIRHSNSWYAQTTNPAVVFTREENEGIREEDLTTLPSYIFIKKEEALPSSFSVLDRRSIALAGNAFERFVVQREDEGTALYYVYSKQGENITLMQYPYDPVSPDTQDFERMVQTFTPTQ